MVLMAYSVISIIKLIGIKDSKQKVIYALLLSFCAGFLFNGLIVEKYVIATFYIIATLKLCEEKNNLKWLTCIGAMGMLTTSVVFVPVVLLYDSKRNIKKFFKEGVLVALLFLCVMIVSGQFNLLFRNTSYVMAKKFSSVDSDITMPDKLLQTLAFFANVLFCPSFNVFSDGSVFQTPCQFGVYTFLGMIIIILLMLNAVFNRNNKFSLICAYWNFMIIIFLFGFGWGSVLDEMFIYSLIFGFTILSSLIILFESIKINSKIKLSVQVLILVMLFTFNVFKLCEITYYLSKVVI